MSGQTQRLSLYDKILIQEERPFCVKIHENKGCPDYLSSNIMRFQWIY
jgi:hypothetical protein